MSCWRLSGVWPRVLSQKYNIFFNCGKTIKIVKRVQKGFLQSASLIEYLDLNLKKETSIILYHIYQVENGTHLFSFGNNTTQNVMRGWRISHDIKCDVGARHKTREASLLDSKSVILFCKRSLGTDLFGNAKIFRKKKAITLK